MQYADDTIVLIDDDLEGARNMKLLLYFFESMSSLKINFQKSELLVLADAEKQFNYAQLFNCHMVHGPLNI